MNRPPMPPPFPYPLQLPPPPTEADLRRMREEMQNEEKKLREESLWQQACINSLSLVGAMSQALATVTGGAQRDIKNVVAESITAADIVLRAYRERFGPGGNGEPPRPAAQIVSLGQERPR